MKGFRGMGLVRLQSASRRHVPRRLMNLSVVQWVLVPGTEASSCRVYSSGTTADMGPASCLMVTTMLPLAGP